MQLSPHNPSNVNVRQIRTHSSLPLPTLSGRGQSPAIRTDMDRIDGHGFFSSVPHKLGLNNLRHRVLVASRGRIREIVEGTLPEESLEFGV